MNSKNKNKVKTTVKTRNKEGIVSGMKRTSTVVVVHICIHGWLVVIVGIHDVCCALIMVMGDCHCSCSWVVVSRCWRRLLWVVSAVYCSCALVVVMGGHCHLLYVSMVAVRRTEAISHIMTMASCLNFHMRSHVNDLT